MRSRESFIKVLCVLEGFKTVVKEFHWIADNLSQHKLFDDVAVSLAEFQDDFAEKGFNLFGQMTQFELIPIRPHVPEPEDCCQYLLNFIIGVTDEISNNNTDNKFNVLINSCDDFASDLNKFVYLGKMK